MYLKQISGIHVYIMKNLYKSYDLYGGQGPTQRQSDLLMPSFHVTSTWDIYIDNVGTAD